MSELFRLGLIGCGRIATRHVKAGLASPLAQVSALVDPARERAEALRDEFGLSSVVATKAADVFDDVDGFIIAAPNHLHRPLAIECLQAKKPVLIEKPLSTTVEDGEAICRTAAETGTIAMVGYVTRFRSHVRLFKQMYDAGNFGRPRRFVYQFGAKGGWTSYSSFNLDREAMGGGVMVGTGSHFLDRMLYWFGYPDQIALYDDSHGGPEATCRAEFAFDNGGDYLQGTVSISKTVGRPAGFVLETDQGFVVLKDDPAAKIHFQPRATPGIEHVVQPIAASPAAEPDSFLLQINDFAAACREGRDPLITAEQGLLSVKLIRDLYDNRAPMPENWYSHAIQESTT